MPRPPSFLLLLLVPVGLTAAVTAQYVRIDNPTGFAMEFRQVEVWSGGRNVVRDQRNMVTGTVPPRPGDVRPTRQSIVVTGPREGGEITNGDTDTSHRASEWRAWTDPVSNANHLNPWIEIDLGRPLVIDRIVVHGSRYPSRFHLDKGHRVIAVLDQARTVVWAGKWQYYDQKAYPTGVFAFTPESVTAGPGPVVGVRIPPRAADWVAMGWLLEAEAERRPVDAERRLLTFADRAAPSAVTALADRIVPLLDARLPAMAEVHRLHAAGRHADALEAWKTAWFAKMARVHLHAAIRSDQVSYTSHGDDLLTGLMVAITPGTARAIRYTPGAIAWVDLPKDGKDLNAAIGDCIAKAAVGKVSWPLLHAYRRSPDPAYIQRWAAIMDDWAMHFFADAATVPYEVEDLFTFNPCHAWGAMMEDLADIAAERPDLVKLMPATTLARVQLICLEKYSTAWWRQARETVFNHTTGGVYAWDTVLPYIDEFHPGQRARQEWRQAFERFMTKATEPDGSLTEIGDEGHQEIPVLFGFNFARAERMKPDWWTPGWHNRAMAWYDNLHKYMYRHLAPGGYEHRFAVDYRPSRWYSTTIPYFDRHPQNPPMLSRDREFFGIPEVRRLLDAFGHISSGVPEPKDPAFKPIAAAQRQAQEVVKRVLGDEKPGLPRIRSDWMPYTGAWYFRGGWEDDAPFCAMLACRSHGGSQAPQWPYGMFYHYDHGFPLVAAKPMLVDGQPPDHLQGRRHTFQPGTKTMALTQAEEHPATSRWSSSDRFDLGEAYFHGSYQGFPGFKGEWDHRLQIVLDDGRGVAGVDSMRQMVQVRRARLFIATDALRVADGKPHDLTLPWTLSLSTRAKDPSRPFGPDQLRLDATAARIASDNPDGPSVAIHHFSDRPLILRIRGEAKPDPRKYARRLTDAIPIAEQQAEATVKAERLLVASVIASRDRGAPDRIARIAALDRQPDSVGFHAVMTDGVEVWYRSAGQGRAPLTCGPAAAVEAQALLLVRDGVTWSGLVLGGRGLTVQDRAIAAPADAEFTIIAGRSTVTPIHTPIAPVAFRPGRNAFTERETVALVSATPGVAIRYTTDGTLPTVSSPLYTAPITITTTTEFAARAWRLGDDGKPLPADDFAINGTRFTEPTFGWFVKRPLAPAATIAADALVPGLVGERVDAPWWSLYASLHWLPAVAVAPVPREMTLPDSPQAEPYGMRFKGWLRIPADGVYTFHAPRELVHMDHATSYDLRVFVDGEEWYLTQWWHGHGTWSIPLKQGFHAFQVDFADARTTPWRKSGIWRYYPRPWAIFPGKPGDLLLSGPGREPARIPPEWLFRSR